MLYSIITDKLNRHFTELKTFITVFCPSHLYGEGGGGDSRTARVRELQFDNQCISYS